MQIPRPHLLGVFLCFAFPAGCAQHSHPPAAAIASSSLSSSSPPLFGEKIQVAGIGDVGKLNEYLFRGPQPNEQGVAELKKLGITTIVDLRGIPRRTIAAEKKQAEALGMHFVNIRASGWAPPTDDQLVEFFSLLQKRPREKLFVHCWFGDDRTGEYLAAYRIAFQHWSAEDAIREMYYFRFKGFWHPRMKTFVRNFPEHFATSPAFAPFRSDASPQAH